MQRFAMFYGDDYYPLGGWKDLAGAFGTKEDAVAAALARTPDSSGSWYQVVDLFLGTIVAEGEMEPPEHFGPPTPNCLSGNEEALTIGSDGKVPLLKGMFR